VDINTNDTSTPTHNQISSPITQARAREQNNQVSSLQASYSSYLDNGNMCSILFLRNGGREQNGDAFAPVTFGFQNISSLWRPPQPSMNLDSGVQILSRKPLESTFICIKPQVHIMSEPAAIIILVQRPFSTNGAVTPYFGPLGNVSCWVKFGCVLGLEHHPAFRRSSYHTYKTLPPSLKTLGFYLLDFALATSTGDVSLAKLPVSCFPEPQPYCVSASKTSHSSHKFSACSTCSF
jgi:hypothetical protein